MGAPAGVMLAGPGEFAVGPPAGDGEFAGGAAEGTGEMPGDGEVDGGDTVGGFGFGDGEGETFGGCVGDFGDGGVLGVKTTTINF